MAKKRTKKRALRFVPVASKNRARKNPFKFGKFIKASAVRFRRVGKQLVVDIKRAV